MDYMHKHGDKRYTPSQLVESTRSVISTTLNYLNKEISTKDFIKSSHDPQMAEISIYAHGRDYHKVLRKKLQKLGNFISTLIPNHSFRAFSDSAPILEKPLAHKAGLGWFGKSGMLLNKEQGSFFFIGDLYSSLDISELEAKKNIHSYCGKCQACIKICPTQAILDNKTIDSVKCISYQTIENKGIIPIDLREKIKNKIYGCDDCQLICHFNNKAPLTLEKDFFIRTNISNKTLLELFSWSEKEFLKNTEGSAIRRIGYIQWLRNIAIAIGNDKYSQKNISSLEGTKNKFNENKLLISHIDWAIKQQKIKSCIL